MINKNELKELNEMTQKEFKEVLDYFRLRNSEREKQSDFLRSEFYKNPTVHNQYEYNESVDYLNEGKNEYLEIFQIYCNRVF